MGLNLLANLQNYSTWTLFHLKRRFQCVFLCRVILAKSYSMRTNILIDDSLMKKAFQLAESKTKKAVIDEALRLFIRIKEQQKIRDMKGKLHWDLDLYEMRFESLY